MKILNTFRHDDTLLQDDPSKLLSRHAANHGPCLFLLRHGQIQGHETRRFIGQTDVPLDETGVSQALFWKKAFSRVRFDRIYSSALSRCQETAALVCPEQKIMIDARLNEISLGSWDGKSFDHIRKSHPELFRQRGEQIVTFRPPRGESFNDLKTRVIPFFEALKQPLESPVLVVTHSGVIRVMLCHYLGMELTKLLETKPAYGQLFLLGKS